MNSTAFDEIRSFRDEEIPAVIQRMIHNESFSHIVHQCCTGQTVEEVRQELLCVHNISELQRNIEIPIAEKWIKSTSEKVSCSGIDNLQPDNRYLFLANHRDITLDSIIFQIYLLKNQFDSTEITFGSNLMHNALLTDFGKANKMFKVYRGGDPRMFYHNTSLVSHYIRDNIINRHQSVWIAQRNGRTKDGDDRTNYSVIKMLALSSSADFVDNLNELKITPLAVSYEYEPCDFLKVSELYASRSRNYVKQNGEDLNSIITGLQQWKGHIQLSITEPITKTELESFADFNRNERFERLANLCDQRIYHKYALWKTNYIAYDLLFQSSRYQIFYSQEDKENFIKYMQAGLSKLDGSPEILQALFLNIYANPVKNSTINLCIHP